MAYDGKYKFLLILKKIYFTLIETIFGIVSLANLFTLLRKP